MKLSEMNRRLISYAIGFLFCSSTAVLTIVLFSGHSHRSAVPLAFIAVAVLASMLWGTAGALTGLLAAAVLFSTFLFSPIGTPKVAEDVARTNIGWMFLLGVPLSYLFAKRPRIRH